MKKKQIQITRMVRPIRLAFLVDVNNKKTLRKIFEINTCLWGGRYNGIIPFLRKRPAWWGGNGHCKLNAKEIIQGYIKAFEPDFLVYSKKDQIKDIEFDNDRMISINDMLNDDQDEHFNYGVSVYDLYKDHYERQFKFKQRNPPQCMLPLNISGPDQLFTASVFGAFPQDSKFNYFESNFITVFEPEKIKINSENYASCLFEKKVSPLIIGRSFLDIRRNSWSKGKTLFFMDKNKSIDLIDFWNLRALGWDVTPLPSDWSDELEEKSKEVVVKNHVPIKGNPNGLMYDTTILKSRSCNEEDFERFANAITIKGKSALIRQHWYPRIWDNWAREHDHVNRCSLVHVEDDYKCSVDEGKITFDNLAPDFKISMYFTGKPKWANIIKLRNYSSSDEFALVFPPNIKDFGRLLNAIPRSMTFSTSSEGLINLVEYQHSKHYWKLPTGFEVFQNWFKDNSLDATLSSPGQVTLQVVKSLEGPFGLRWIAHPKILRLLDKMAHGLDESEQDDDEIRSKKPVKLNRMASRDCWWQLLYEINDKNQKAASRHFEVLNENRVLKIGLKLECTVCQQNNWYSLEDIQEMITCSRCLQEFAFPKVKPPTQSWNYKTQGPFSVENFAQGSYTVALAIRFLTETIDSNSTWAPSMNISGKNGVDLECDFAIWRTGNRLKELSPQLIFGECKSFNTIEAKDVKRTKELAEKFPGSILVFCTLREKLTDEEKKRIAKLVRWGRESLGDDKLRAPVLILTGIELFGEYKPPICWKNQGGKFAKFANDYRNYSEDLKDLCEATQILHLDLESYWDWLGQKRKKKTSK